MSAFALKSYRWAAAAHAEAADTSPMELSALGAHVHHCQDCHGRWFALECWGETLHSLLAPRFVTTLAVATLILGGVALVL